MTENLRFKLIVNKEPIFSINILLNNVKKTKAKEKVHVLTAIYILMDYFPEIY